MKTILATIAMCLVVGLSYGQGKTRKKTTCDVTTKQDYDTLIINYKKAIELNPQDEAAYNQLGMSYFSLADFNAASIYFSKLIELNPKYPGAYSNRAICKLMLKNKTGACEDFNACIANGEGNEKIMDGKSIKDYVKSNCGK